MGLHETALLGHDSARAEGGALERAGSHATALATAAPAQLGEPPATGSHSYSLAYSHTLLNLAVWLVTYKGSVGHTR